jgi:hypothetical protein
MKKPKNKRKGYGVTLILFLSLIFSTHVKSQTYTLYSYGDVTGDALADWTYYVSNGYMGVLKGIPSGQYPTGTQAVWAFYYIGTYVGTTIAHTAIDLDGYQGWEIPIWLMPNQSFYIITPRTNSGKGYYVGSTGINSWVQCNNSWTNLDGLPGNEIMLNYYARSASSKKGLMIRHRVSATKSTWSCFNLTREAGGTEDPSEPEDEIVNNNFDNTEFMEKGRIMTEQMNKLFKGLVIPPYAKEFKVEDLLPVTGTITISPNPAVNTVSIKTATPDEIIRQVVISNVSGKPVQTLNGNSRQVDISQLKKGLYFIRVVTDKAMYSEKVLKM